MINTFYNILAGRSRPSDWERREREIEAVRAELSQQVQGVQSGTRVLKAVAENVELNHRRS